MDVSYHHRIFAKNCLSLIACNTLIKFNTFLFLKIAILGAVYLLKNAVKNYDVLDIMILGHFYLYQKVLLYTFKTMLDLTAL